MKARNEQDVLKHMTKMTKHGSGLLSHRLPSWTEAKKVALQVMDLHCMCIHGRHVESVLDVGIGDMAVMEAWERFTSVDYVGVDGCPEVLARAMRRHPERKLYKLTIGEMILGGMPIAPDAVLLMDVLYHIPSAGLAEELVQWAADSSAEYLVLTYATDPSQQFDEAPGPGEPGFAWFPHPFTRPEGWDVIHQEDAKQGQQSQRVVVLTRNTAE